MPASNTSFKHGLASHARSHDSSLVSLGFNETHLGFELVLLWSLGIPTEKDSSDLSGELSLNKMKINCLWCLALMNQEMSQGGKC